MTDSTALFFSLSPDRRAPSTRLGRSGAAGLRIARREAHEEVLGRTVWLQGIMMPPTVRR
jgi:hypothetical protein